ncbi:MAG: glycosyltransferase, partial [Actinomycetota bacterium]|nr:glycosyltransferase [Actinomycetota bacterium]
MTGNSLLVGAVNAAAFMLSASFLAYVVSIVIPLVRHRSAGTGDPSGFQWYFLLPCLNEERVIEETIHRLTSRFPQSQVWCVDDASSDQTAEILARLAARDSRIHVVSRQLPEAQEGKGPA